MDCQKESWQQHSEEVFIELEQEVHRCLAAWSHINDDTLGAQRKEVAAMEAHDRTEAVEKLHTESFTKASTSIFDLPEGILERILRSACVDTQHLQADGEFNGVSAAQVNCMRTVCATWRDLVLSSYKRARCDSLGGEDLALSQLHTLKNVTHVGIRQAVCHEHIGFLTRLATGFPLLTSFQMCLGGTEKDLAALSLFLSLKTNVRELELISWTKRADPVAWDSYSRALEKLDFTPQVHLKKLTLAVAYPAYREIPARTRGGCRIPVSTTLPQLAALRELHIKVEDLAEVAALPHWLAELPAFVGLQIFNMHGAPCSSFLDSLSMMPGLRELVIHGHRLNDAEFEVLPRMSHLTWLELGKSQDLAAMEHLRLTTTLRKLFCAGDMLPMLGVSLPVLEELILTDVSSVETSNLAYFERTPNVSSLSIALREEEGSWPHLERLTGLTCLTLNRSLWRPAPEEPIWHICEAQTPALQILGLQSCKLLRLIDGLLTLEHHLVVSVCCTCQCEDGPWFSSYAEHVAGGSVCCRLPDGVARQLFKDSRRPTAKPPGPCLTCPTFRNRDPEDENPEIDDAEDDSDDDDSDDDRAEDDNLEHHHLAPLGAWDALEVGI